MQTGPTRSLIFIFLISVLCLQNAFSQEADQAKINELFDAARSGDLKVVKAAIESGIDVNVANDYDSTPLFFACERGHVEVAKFLLDNGANPNVKDNFYGATALTWAENQGHQDIVNLLIKAGLEDVDQMLLNSIRRKRFERTQLIMESGTASEAVLPQALYLAKKNDDAKSKWADLFKGMDIEEFVPFEPTTEDLQKYVGKFASGQRKLETFVQRSRLRCKMGAQQTLILRPVTEHKFSSGPYELSFAVNDNKVQTLTVSMGSTTVKFERASDMEAAESTETPPANESESTEAESAESKTEFGPDRRESLLADLKTSSVNWPGFKGNGSRGVAEGQKPPVKWQNTDDEQQNIAWKTDIPGLGNSCPSIWGNQLFITSAVSNDDSGEYKIGQYGSVDSVKDDSVYKFNLYCLDKKTGTVLWQRTANEGKPAVKRHAKSSHANPTVATDGKHVIAFFGSEGLYCYSMAGDLIWKKDLGLLDSGWFYDPGYQWGFGASPTIFEDKVIVQCDIQKSSFIAAYDIETGDQIWKTERDEIPGWSSPTIHRFDDLPMLITQGTRAARGYDARTGEELWHLPKQSEIVVPTPFVAHGMIFIASGYRPIQPIYAIRPSARGDISLTNDAKTNEHISWSYQRGGPYMPSPIVYGDYLYSCSNSGILDCYDAVSGAKVYRSRIRVKGGGPSFTASPLAADGHVYFTNEDGQVIVVKAGPKFEIVSNNKLGENILATPAISDGMIYFRTQNSLIAVGEVEK